MDNIKIKKKSNEKDEKLELVLPIDNDVQKSLTLKQPNASETLQTSPLEKSGLKAVVDTTGEKTESVEYRLIKNEGEGTEIKKEIDSKFLNIMKTKQANKCECEECVGKRIEKKSLKRVTQKVRSHSSQTTLLNIIGRLEAYQ